MWIYYILYIRQTHTGRWREMLRSKEIDAVYISLSLSLHFSWVADAINVSHFFSSKKSWYF